MKIIDALRVFDSLKKRRIFRDYAIGGAVAVSYYVEPRATRDLDIFLLGNYEEHKLTWEVLQELGYKRGEHAVVEGVPVDIVPSSQHPFYEEAIRTAKRVKVEDFWTKIFTPEYLIATKLLRFSNIDRVDILNLLEYRTVDMRELKDILSGGFKGDKKLLTKRLHRVLEEEERS